VRVVVADAPRVRVRVRVSYDAPRVRVRVRVGYDDAHLNPNPNLGSAP